MIDQLALRCGDRFREWLSTHVRFCSSLVDRITTGSPPPEARAALEASLGYSDDLLTVTEPYALWAIEGEPAALRTAFPIDVAPEPVVFASDIGMYRERKLRLLNGAHTALAPLALLAGVPTVREAVEHPRLGPLLERVLFHELVPGTDVPAAAARSFAAGVVERFRNPWLRHEWRVIATNQTMKMRVRVDTFARSPRGHRPGRRRTAGGAGQRTRSSTPISRSSPGTGWRRTRIAHPVPSPAIRWNAWPRARSPTRRCGALPWRAFPGFSRRPRARSRDSSTKA